MTTSHDSDMTPDQIADDMPRLFEELARRPDAVWIIQARWPGNPPEVWYRALDDLGYARARMPVMLDDGADAVALVELRPAPDLGTGSQEELAALFARGVPA